MKNPQPPTTNNKANSAQPKTHTKPVYQFCHSIEYNGKKFGRNEENKGKVLTGNKVTVCVMPTSSQGIYVVSHSIVSEKDNFSRKMGRNVTVGRIEKHLNLLNTNPGYVNEEEYIIDTGIVDEKRHLQLECVVKRYKHADVVVFGKDTGDERDQINLIFFMFQEGQIYY